jgi:hypothetical protein
MRRRHLASLSFDKDWGLTARSLDRLGDVPVQINVLIRPRCDDARLFRLAPRVREATVAARMRSSFQALVRDWPGQAWSRNGPVRKPWGVIGSVPARSIPRLLRHREVDLVAVREIPGRAIRRRRPERPGISWCSVKGRYAVQIEGRSRGLQTFEDRVLLVRAHTEDEARRMAWTEARDYASPYLNSDRYMVRWQLERVLEVQDVWTRSKAGPDPRGTEVWSEFNRPRISRGSIWRPRMEYRKRRLVR